MSNQPLLWTEEIVRIFGPAILLEEDLTEDEAAEYKVAENKSGEEQPAKKRSGAKGKHSIVYTVSKKTLAMFDFFTYLCL